ncbi:MAG: hypothetical protein WC516_09120 [Patescibacteria group bacterium]
MFCLSKDDELDVRLAGNSCHVFCVIGNRVIDITATQFNHPDKVAIGKVNEWPSEYQGSYVANYWEVKWSNSTLEEAKASSRWFLDCYHEHDRKFVLKELVGEQIAL